MLRDAMLEKAREQLGDGNVARLAAEVAEHKRDPYTLVEEIARRQVPEQSSGELQAEVIIGRIETSSARTNASAAT